MDIDRVIGEITAGQRGVVTRRQLRVAGVDRHAEARRVAAGVLVRLSATTLRLAGAPVTDEQRVVAAVLDVAGGAIASFTTAGWLWQLPGIPLGRVEVTARRAQSHASPLALVHRPVRHLHHHVTTVRGIEVTDLPWTIFDLASSMHPKRIERLVDTVCARTPSTLAALHRLLPVVAGKGKPGITTMRAVLEQRPIGIRVPGSGQQRRFEELMARAGITGLRREVDLGGHEWIGRVDYVCELTGVVFEIDSELHHSSPSDLAADAARDAKLLAAGAPEVVRIATETLWSRPADVPSIVRRARSRALSGAQAHRSQPEKAS